MMYPSRGFFLAIVILLRCEDSTALRPNITAEADEIIKNEGDPLEIVCSGTKKLFFIYPNEFGDLVTTSTPKINEYQDDDGTYRYEFRRPETVYGDTGWYGCADHTVDVTHDSYFDPDISWVYVYVQSNTNLFVEQNNFATLYGTIGENAIIPCRPTSPNFTVQLTQEEIVLELGDRLSFDPRFGFTLKNLSVKDTAYFICTIKQNNVDNEVIYYLNTFRRVLLNEPKILEDTLGHVTRGQTLRLNCTTEVEKDIQYALYWITPQESSRIATRESSTTEYGTNIRRATIELIIENVTDEDEGFYQCVIQSFHDSKIRKKYIKVHGPVVYDNSFIKYNPYKGY